MITMVTWGIRRLQGATNDSNEHTSGSRGTDGNDENSPLLSLRNEQVHEDSDNDQYEEL